MNLNNQSLLHRALRDQRGQVLPMIALVMIGLLGMVAFTVDVGDVYYSYHQLQASTDAAALAGAMDLPNNTATATATSYSSVTGNRNAYSDLHSVAMVSGYPKVECLATLTAEGDVCVAPAGGNAMQVKQQASVPMYFARLFGVTSVPIVATSTAAARGAVAVPYNVAIIVDSTQSMNDQDTTSNCNSKRITCALDGVRVLLNDMAPCASSESTCGAVTNGNVANAVDRTSLFTFPGVTSTTGAQDDSNCSGTPQISNYTYPTLPTYQIVGFSSDYRTSDTSGSLNTSSSLVDASGGKTGCAGLQAIGGAGTYYAGVIYAAQAALVAEQSLYPNTQNVIILLSDGDATASSSQMTSKNNNGTYPSDVDECEQAVQAAQAAATAGTRVYSVAYGSPTSGCSTDTSGISPCTTMKDIASAPQYFYSDYTTGTGESTCAGSSQPATNLNQIFTDIASDFTVARLIPDNTT